MIITKLRTNHIDNPVGYYLDKISLSWMVGEAKGTKASKVRVQISTDESFQELIYDSGEMESADSLDFTVALEPKDAVRYYWHVQVWDDAGDSAVSDTAYFETARKLETAKWIQAPFSQKIHPLFEKKFAVSGKIKRAMLYITGLGVYEAYINGEKAGEEYLVPFFNDYNLWIQYQTYDVTAMINSGGNAVGVMLGNGWYKGRFGYIDKLDDLYGDSFSLIAEIHLEYEDGTSEVIGTDESWMCAPSPVIESSIYDGEVYDSRKEIKDWATAKCSEEGFVNAVCTEGFSDRLMPRLSLPLKIMDRIKPVEVITTNAGEKVIDFGQIMSGVVEFTCRESEGSEIFFQFGEILQNGNFYNENLRTAKEEYRYISDGTVRKVRPYFTFYGFRYMKVTGIEDIRLEDFTGCVMYSEMDRIGNITTSNPKVNKLFQNAFWGQIGNFLDVPTDCPQRDERMGWTGDAQVFVGTANLNMYTPAFYRKYMYDLKKVQDTLEGSVPHVVPDILGQIGRRVHPNERVVNKSHGSCAWADAAAVIPWTLYKSFGDKTLLEEQYDSMKDWVDYIRKVDVEKCGGEYLWRHGFHFADWLALDNCFPQDCEGATDPYYVASAYYYYSASLTAKAAKALGKERDARYYRELAEKVKQAIQREYFTVTGRIAVDTQTAMALALAMDFVPPLFKDRLAEDFMNKLEATKMHLSTGFVGTAFLCAALTECGHSEAAYTLLLNEDYPSWLYEVNMGATTVWERWNSVLPDGSISDTGMNSLNHYAYGAIVEWMYRYMCGLNSSEEAPGYKKFTVSPYVDQRFDWVSMKYESGYGKIESGWKKTEKGYDFQVEVPFDTEADFVLTMEAENVSVNGKTEKSMRAGEHIRLSPGKWIIAVEI